jgi:flagellar biosynthetic protein FliR
LENLQIPLHPVLVFMVVLARVGGLVTFAPFWSHKGASMQIRAVLAGILALSLTPVVMTKIQTPPSEIGPLTLVLMGEMVIGMTLGFVGKLVFSAFEFAAHIVSSQMGFSLAGTIDPSTQAQTAAFGMIAQMLALMVLLAVDGHHWFLMATVKSFTTTPPGSFAFSAELLDLILRLSGNALVVGVTLAAPAIIVLLSVELALEFLGRTAPQLQVYFLGFPLKIAVGLWVLGTSVYLMPTAFRGVMETMYHNLVQALGAMGTI